MRSGSERLTSRGAADAEALPPSWAILATVAIGAQSVAAAGWSRPGTIIARAGGFQSAADLTADGVPEAVATCGNDIYQFEQGAAG